MSGGRERAYYLARKRLQVRTVLRKGESVLKIPSILARGGNAFFLVATLQDAETAPPEVKITGTGLDATVTVGARRVTFDGRQIVIVDASQRRP